MANSDQLRVLRTGTVINLTSRAQEKDIERALKRVVERLRDFAPIALVHSKEWKLDAICARLRRHFPDVDFHCHFHTSGIRPDGGFLWLVANDNEQFPLLIAEVKNQGTNDRRAQEGLPRQARGNAIERQWSVDEMVEILFEVAKRAVQYYFSKYGEKRFLPEG